MRASRNWSGPRRVATSESHTLGDVLLWGKLRVPTAELKEAAV
jgi:hypothetical protein